MCRHQGKHHLFRRSATLLLAVLAALGVLGFTYQATATAPISGDVDFRFHGRIVWVDQPFTAEVDIINAENFSDPVVPPVDGLDVQVQPGSRESTYTQIINGRSSTRTTRTGKSLSSDQHGLMQELSTFEHAVFPGVRIS